MRDLPDQEQRARVEHMHAYFGLGNFSCADYNVQSAWPTASLSTKSARSNPFPCRVLCTHAAGAAALRISSPRA